MDGIVRSLAGVVVVGVLAIAVLCGCQGDLKFRASLDVDASWQVERLQEGEAG